MAPAPVKRFILRGRDPHAQFDALLERNNVEALNLASSRDDTFRKAESDGKVFEVAGRGHHHSMRRPIVGQCDRRFFGKEPITAGDDLPAPPHVFDARDWRREPRGRREFSHEAAIPLPFTMRTGTPLPAGTKLPLA